jgi:hypothetical protein
MKRITHQFTHPTALAIAAVLVVFMVLACAGPSSAASRRSHRMTGAKALTSEHVEARIKYLHTKLSIAPEQEELWNEAAQVMRYNAKTMDELVKARSENAAIMNAVDDLKSYSEIAEVHADGLKKFIPVFESLYASMSDDQKKHADTLFHHQGRHHGHAKSKAKGK